MHIVFDERVESSFVLQVDARGQEDLYRSPLSVEALGPSLQLAAERAHPDLPLMANCVTRHVALPAHCLPAPIPIREHLRWLSLALLLDARDQL